MDRLLLQRKLQSRIRDKNRAAVMTERDSMALQHCVCAVEVGDDDIAPPCAARCITTKPASGAGCGGDATLAFVHAQDTEAVLPATLMCGSDQEPACGDSVKAALSAPVALVGSSDEKPFCGESDKAALSTEPVHSNNATRALLHTQNAQAVRSAAQNKKVASTCRAQSAVGTKPERSSNATLAFVHAQNTKTARMLKKRWKSAMRAIEDDMSILLQKTAMNSVKMRFLLQHTIAKRQNMKPQKRAILATLQYAFLSGIVHGTFSDDESRAFVGWLTFCVLQPQPFAELVFKVFAGINRHSVDMALRRCGFKMAGGLSFQQLHLGLGPAEFDPEQMMRYATGAKTATVSF